MRKLQKKKHRASALPSCWASYKNKSRAMSARDRIGVSRRNNEQAATLFLGLSQGIQKDFQFHNNRPNFFRNTFGTRRICGVKVYMASHVDISLHISFTSQFYVCSSLVLSLLAVLSVFGQFSTERKLIILRKSEKIATLTNYFIHSCPCFHLTLNKIPLSKTKNASDV